MSKSIVATLATGYLAILVQALVGFALVPFLLSRHGVGLAGFGSIAAIQAAVMAPGLLLDGYRQDSARRIAHWVMEGRSDAFSGLVTFALVLVAVIAAFLVAAARPIAGFLELEFAHGVAALCCAAFSTILEEYCYLFDSSLHAAKRSPVAQMLGVTDTLMRAGLVVAIFLIDEPSVAGYFAAILVALVTKAAMVTVVSPMKLAHPRQPLLNTLKGEAMQFIRAVPLSLNAAAPYLVFRSGVILGKKVLGAEAAGVLALILVTLRNYLTQATFSALRPMLISRLASVDLADPQSRDALHLTEYLRLYTGILYALGIVAICAAPMWVTLWLGTEIRPYAPYFMVALAGYIIEVASGIQYYSLVAHNQARSLALVNGAVAVVCAALTTGIASFTSSLWTHVLVVVVYLSAYGALTRHYFRQRIRLSTRSIDKQTLAAGCLSVAGGAAVFASGGDAMEAVVIAAIATGLFVFGCLRFKLVDLDGAWNRRGLRSAG